MKKKTHGGAYIMVLVATMAMFLLIYAALAVTARSRETTARHEHFANLYDLAVAGNEHVLRELNQYLAENRNEILEILEILHPFDENPPDRTAIITTAIPVLNRAITANQTRTWTITVDYTPNRGATIRDHYRATTTIENLSVANPTERITVSTTVHTYIGEILWPVATEVEATIYWREIIWLEDINFLDDSMLAMVELMRIAV